MFSPDLFVATLAVIGVVIAVSAILSGVVERTRLPQVAVFLALGAVMGPYGLGFLHIGIESPILRVVATLSLVLVLFTDAVSLNLSDLRTHKGLGFLVLGPGTLMSAFLVFVFAIWLLNLPTLLAAMLAAALASTDPVILRGILRRPELAGPARQALRLESGLNDAVLVPIVLVAMAIVQAGQFGAGDWARLLLNMFILSPAAGVVIALAAIGSLELVRRKAGVRRDYESLYSLGIAFAAYAAGEVAHGSGFIAAFAAGITVNALDVELCDCFLEYGETTAEMALLFTFVLFGISLIWSGLGVLSWTTLAFALLTLVVARPAAFLPALAPARIKARDRALIAWFGPRGLSSLLLILLPVFANVEGSRNLLVICCLVVLFSVVLHGFSPMFVFRDRKPEGPTQPPVPESSGVAAEQPEDASRQLAAVSNPEYVTLEELERVDPDQAPIVVDARSHRSFDASSELIPGAVRIAPDRTAAEATRLNLPKDRLLAVLCA